MPNFFSKRTFKNQPKPDPKKNFFQNYDDHLNSLFVKLYKTFPINNWEELQHLAISRPYSLLGQVSNEAIKHLYLFDALYDGYDYFDEVVGATALPALAGLASLGLTAAAIWEAIQALAIKFGFQQCDQEKHLDKATANLLLAGTAFVLSVASYIKSMISLFTRPLVTLINGFKPQNVDRFTIDDSKEDDLTAFLRS
ncbi:hypothetical protein [Legionella sp. km772]|uniref:hypothetical protein n=1 Tax=Legionella sp. km772 TaxID=2498111 RepID=UPI000F8F24A4|nr:hypothetical protein [Legionella sp. km772]RUR13058.1 hypothetical protein ELY15_03335 [Legionella sp. km772]